MSLSVSAAPIIVSPGDKGTDVDGRVPSGGDQNCKVKVSDGGATVKVRIILP